MLAPTCMVGLSITKFGALLVHPVRAPTAIVGVGAPGAPVADAAGVGVRVSERARVGTLAAQQEDEDVGYVWVAAVYGAARLRQL